MRQIITGVEVRRVQHSTVATVTWGSAKPIDLLVAGQLEQVLAAVERLSSGAP